LPRSQSAIAARDDPRRADRPISRKSLDDKLSQDPILKASATEHHGHFGKLPHHCRDTVGERAVKSHCDHLRQHVCSPVCEHTLNKGSPIQSQQVAG